MRQFWVAQTKGDIHLNTFSISWRGAAVKLLYEKGYGWASLSAMPDSDIARAVEDARSLSPGLHIQKVNIMNVDEDGI